MIVPRRTTTKLICLSLFLFTLIISCVQKPTQTPKAARLPLPPTRLLFLKFAAFSPSFIDEYSMQTFQQIRTQGLSFPNAYIGHLGSSPELSNAVIRTGLFPKHLEEFLNTHGRPRANNDRKPPPDRLALLDNILAEAPHNEYTANSSIELTPPPLSWGPVAVIADKFSSADLFFLSKNTLNLSTQPKPLTNSVSAEEQVWEAILQWMKQHENWRAIFASFPRMENSLNIDKTLQLTDKHLASLIAFLDKTHILNETLIVITAESGIQANSFFHGMPGLEVPLFTYGKGSSFHSGVLPPTLTFLEDTELLKTASLDTILRFWLKKTDAVSQAKFTKALKKAPGIAEIYVKQRTPKNIHYIRHYRDPLLEGEALEWAKEHHQELVETMASNNSPDALGLLHDGHSYAGTSGGTQRQLQSIPLIILSPFEAHRGRAIEIPIRLVDLTPTILKLMKIQTPENLDGSSAPVDTL